MKGQFRESGIGAHRVTLVIRNKNKNYTDLLSAQVRIISFKSLDPNKPRKKFATSLNRPQLEIEIINFY